MTYTDTKTIIHCHSEHSLKDSPLKIQTMVARAKEMGVQNLTLTDHGTCTGWFEFRNACIKAGINPILGVEAYVKTDYAPHAHMILLAKNYAGMQEISRAVSDANAHLETIGSISSPIMDMEILKKYFSGSNNVFATSACVNGVLSTVLLSNKTIEKRIASFQKRIKKYNAEGYAEKLREEQELDTETEMLTKQKNSISKIASKKYTQREKNIQNRKKNGYDYKELESALQREKDETKAAAEELEKIKQALANTKKKRTILHKEVVSLKNAYNKISGFQNEIAELSKKITDRDTLMLETENMLCEFKSIFGSSFLIELQYHGLDIEREVMPVLADIAKRHKVPVVAANDAHVATREQASARQFVKALRFSRWDPISEADKELYLKTDEELYMSLTEILDKDVAENAIFNTRIIGDNCKIELPSTPHYPKYISSGNEGTDPKQILRKMTLARIPERFPNNTFTQEYKERMEYELNVICDLGYADYFLIVQDYINHAKKLALTNNPLHVGYGVGPGRGSGCGSIVCYLLGITNIDPIKYSLIFERFLNKERVSMPDIDADFSDEVREQTIEYVKEKYGEESVACIRTAIKQGPKAAIRNSARLKGFEIFGSSPKSISDVTKTYEVDEEEEEKNAELKEKWEENMKSIRRLGDEIAKLIPDKPGTKFSECDTMLREKYAGNQTALDIITRAEETEDVITGLSIHAAGVVIGDGSPLKDTVPLMYNTSKEQWAIQCDMIEAEHDLKLLKMDFLGLNNLNIITDCIRTIKENTGVTVPIDNLPQEEEVYREIFSKGNTSCVFQFESNGMKQMLRDFQPSCFEDIILLVAAYRPGPMQYLPAVIARKHNREETKYVTELLRPILQETYGATIYQEQVMQIFQKLAGYSYGYADNVRRAMSKKHEDELEKERSSFIYGDPDRNIPGCQKEGIAPDVANKLFDEMMDFASYAFNKAHATAYAFIGYQTAYLKYHYPAEYMCAVMKNAKVNDIPALLSECKRMGIELSTPDVNTSEMDFVTHNGTIIYGLHAIKGLDDNSAERIIAERRENGAYISFVDFMLRTKTGSGAIEKLLYAGALDSIDETISRDSKYASSSEITDVIKVIDKKDAIITEVKEKLYNNEKEEKETKALLKKEDAEKDTSQSGKEDDSQYICESKSILKDELLAKIKELEKSKRLLKRRLDAAGEARMQAYEHLAKIKYSNERGNIEETLKKEKELLGSYISSHPMNEYVYVFLSGECSEINSAKEGKCSYAGIIEDLRIVKRRSDKSDMAFFELEDLSGIIHVCVFAQNYEKYSKYIKEGDVIKVTGTVKNEGKDGTDDLKIIASSISECPKYQDPLVIMVESEKYDSLLKMIVQQTKSKNGRPTYLYYKTKDGVKCCRFEKAEYRIKDEILDISPEGIQAAVFGMHAAATRKYYNMKNGKSVKKDKTQKEKTDMSATEILEDFV